MVLFIPVVSIRLFYFARIILKLNNITTRVALAVFSKFKFTVVFQELFPLSYFPYWLKAYDENMWVILLQYSPLWLYILYEWNANRRQKIHSSQKIEGCDLHRHVLRKCEEDGLF